MIAVSFSVPFENPGFREQRDRLEIWFLGIGLPTATNALAAHLSRKRPQLLIISGFAGALDPRIHVGKTFLCKNMSNPDAVQALLSKGWMPPPTADLYTTEQLAATVKEKVYLRQATGMDLVDMETRSLFEMAAFHSIPAITIRAVSDAATTNFPMPEAILYNRRYQRSRPIMLAGYLAMNPLCIPNFLRMLRHIAQARTQLGIHLRTTLGMAHFCNSLSSFQ